MALKACRECKKEISSDAKVCPSCGKKSPHGPSAIVKYGGGFVLALFGLPMMFAMCSGLASNRHSASTTVAAAAEPAAVGEAAPAEPAAPALEVTAMKLWRDYEANEVAADNMYRGRVLAVQGTVSGVRKDFANNIVLELASPNQFLSTSAKMYDSEASTAANLSKGTPVTVVCQDVHRIVGSPHLTDCLFAR